MYCGTGITESFYCVNSFEFSASLSKCVGVTMGNRKGNMEQTDKQEIFKKMERSKYVGKTVVRNGRSKRQYKTNNKGRKILSAVDLH
jgi:hypothetical protein